MRIYSWDTEVACLVILWRYRGWLGGPSFLVGLPLLSTFLPLEVGTGGIEEKKKVGHVAFL